MMKTYIVEMKGPHDETTWKDFCDKMYREGWKSVTVPVGLDWTETRDTDGGVISWYKRIQGTWMKDEAAY